MCAMCSVVPASRAAVHVVPMPASLGLACTSSLRIRLAFWISSGSTVAGSS